MMQFDRLSGQECIKEKWDFSAYEQVLSQKGVLVLFNANQYKNSGGIVKEGSCAGDGQSSYAEVCEGKSGKGIEV